MTLADDVAGAVEQLRGERGQGISAAVNELVRRDLANSPCPKRFRQASSKLALPALPIHDVAGLLDVLGGPASG